MYVRANKPVAILFTAAYLCISHPLSEGSYGVIMTCNSCKKKVDDAVWYEANLLCYPCYGVWEKADEEARNASINLLH